MTIRPALLLLATWLSPAHAGAIAFDLPLTPDSVNGVGNIDRGPVPATAPCTLVLGLFGVVVARRVRRSPG